MVASIGIPRTALRAILAAGIFGALIPLMLCADEAEDQFAVAAGHYTRQRWELAAEEFAALLRDFPNNTDTAKAHFYRGEALLQLGRLEEAKTDYAAYLQLQPQGEFAKVARFRQAQADYILENSAPAKSELERFLAQYPGDPLNAYVLTYLGDLAADEDNFALAGQHYQQALDEFPEAELQDECRVGLARALEKQGQTDQALRLYRAVAGKRASRQAGAAAFRLGALLYELRRYDAAIDTFREFATRYPEDPNRAEAQLGHGWALMKLGRLDEAKQWFAQLASDPKLRTEARYWLAMTQRAEKDWAAAASTLLEAAGENPDHELADAIAFYAADSLDRAGDHTGAIARYDRLLGSLPPDSPFIEKALLGKIQAALKARDYRTVDRETAAFARRFRDSPLAADAQRALARSLMERDEFPRAAATLKPLVQPGPGDDLEARFLLALAYRGEKQDDLALRTLEPVTRSAGGRLKADALLAQGSLLMAMERFADAVHPLESYLADYARSKNALTCRAQLAVCYARLGKLDEAKRRYAELVALRPQDKLLSATREQLADAAYIAGDMAWAGELFQSVAAEDNSADGASRGLLGLGWSQFGAGQLDKAAETFGRLLRSNPRPQVAAEAALARGRILEQLDQPEAALGMYRLVIDKLPETSKRAEALLAAARTNDRLQRDQQAESLYAQLDEQWGVLRRDDKFPGRDTVLYEWAWVLEDLGRNEEADRLFERIRRGFPHSRFFADATYRLARQSYQAKDLAKAGALADELLAGDPNPEIREPALYLAAQIAAAKEDWAAVAGPLEELLARFPQSSLRPAAEFWIAEAAYRQGEHQAAGELLERLDRQTLGRREPWMAMIALRRAQVLAQDDKWDEAYTVASGIEKEYPDFPQQYEVDYLIGRCLANRADFEGAREAYRRAIHSPEGEKTETAAMAQWMIGESYFHQKNYEAALRAYHRVELLYDFPTWQAAALLQAGKCRELLGEWGEAARLYSRLIDEFPGTPFTEEAAQRLSVARRQTGA